MGLIRYVIFFLSQHISWAYQDRSRACNWNRDWCFGSEETQDRIHHLVVVQMTQEEKTITVTYVKYAQKPLPPQVPSTCFTIWCHPPQKKEGLKPCRSTSHPEANNCGFTICKINLIRQKTRNGKIMSAVTSTSTSKKDLAPVSAVESQDLSRVSGHHF